MNYYNSCNFPPKSLHGWKYRTILKVQFLLFFRLGRVFRLKPLVVLRSIDACDASHMFGFSFSIFLVKL